METQDLLDDFDESDKVSSELNLWDYSDQEQIFGIVSKVNPNGMYGLSVTLHTSSDEEITIPSLTQLNTALKDVKVGAKVKIISKGKQKSKTSKYSYETFDVFIKAGK